MALIEPLQSFVGLPLEGEIDGPLFRPLVNFESNQEVAAFLRVALDASSTHEEPRMSSHSLKRTPLSWTSNGLSSPGLQQRTRVQIGQQWVKQAFYIKFSEPTVWSQNHWPVCRLRIPMGNQDCLTCTDSDIGNQDCLTCRRNS